MPTPAPIPDAGHEPPDRGRRDVLHKGAAAGAIIWTAPAILASTPAAAATSAPPPPTCTNYLIDWDDTSRFGATGSTFTSTTYATPGITVGISSTFLGGATAGATNFDIVNGPLGSVAGRGLALAQSWMVGGGQIVTLTFSKQVRNVVIPFTDLDNSTGRWSERLVIDTVPFTYSIPTASDIVGSGVAGDAFRNSRGTPVANTSSGGNVVVSWAGPLFQVSFEFLSGTNGTTGTEHRINMRDISYCR